MRKIISAVAATLVTAMSVSSAFAGEYDTTVKIEKSGGLLNLSSNISVSVKPDSVETTSNFVSKEVSGMTPAYDSTKYLVEGPFLKFSLQDMAGKEIELKEGLEISFNGIKDSYKNPVLLMNANDSIVELTGSYISMVKNFKVENVKNVNGVFAIAEKLEVGATASTGALTAAPTDLTSVALTGAEVQTAVTSASGVTTGTGIDLAAADSTNVQDREKGANVYALMLGLMLVVTAGGAMIYRKA